MITQIQDFIARQKWVFAKTMPQHPHEYVVKKNLSFFNQRLFEQITSYIRLYGRDERYLGTHPVRQYLYLGEWKYWTMGAPVLQTTILNRAKTEAHPYDKMQYETLFTGPDDLAEEKELVDMAVEHIFGYKPAHKHTLAFMNEPATTAHVLDIGCGDGLFIRYSEHPNHLYTGFDPSIRMLNNFAAAHPNYEPRLFLTRVEDVAPRLNERFDAIIALYGPPNYIPFQFFPMGMQRLLAPGGKYFLCFFKEGYSPLAYERSGIKADHFVYSKELLEETFGRVVSWRNYNICMNA